MSIVTKIFLGILVFLISLLTIPYILHRNQYKYLTEQECTFMVEKLGKLASNYDIGHFEKIKTIRKTEIDYFINECQQSLTRKKCFHCIMAANTKNDIDKCNCN